MKTETKRFYHLLAINLILVTAYGFFISACTSKSNSSSSSGDGASTFYHPGTTTGTTSSAPRSTTSKTSSLTEDITLFLSSTQILVPAATFDVEVDLLLQAFFGGYVESSTLKLLNSPVRFIASYENTILTREDVRKDMVVTITTTAKAVQKNVVILVYANPDSETEQKYAITASNFSVKQPLSGLYEITFVTRETDAAFVAADTGGSVPAGYDSSIEPPPDPEDLTGEALTPASVRLNWTSAQGSTEGFKLAYGYGDNEPTSCAAGLVVEPTLEETTYPIIGTTITAMLDVSELEDGKDYVFRVCAINGRTPPDTSNGISVAVSTPARALAVLTDAPTDPSNTTALNVTVGGDNLIQYKYVLLSGEDASGDCSTATYSEWVTVNTKITDALTTDQDYKLCVLGYISETNEQLIATEHPWVKDTTPPGAFTIASMDALLNVRTPTITWVESTDAVEYQLVVATDSACATANQTHEDLTSTSKQATSLVDGTYYLCMTSYDAAGNITDATNNGTVTFEIDATPPAAFSITGPTANTNDSTPTVTWEASVGASSYNLLIDDTTGCSSALQTYEEITGVSKVLTALTDGTYYVCMTSADDATNSTTATNSNYTFTLDTVPPTFTSVDLAGDATDTFINLAERSTTNPLITNLTGSGYDAAGYKLATLATTCDGALTYGAIPNSDSVDFGADGSYKVCVKLSDTAGNAAYGASSTITLDATAPVFTSVALANEAVGGYINLAESSIANDLIGSLTGSGYDDDYYKLITAASTCDGTLTYDVAIPKNDSADFTADGAYKVCVKLTDTAGNITYGSSGNITLDKTVPAFTSIALLNDAADSYINASEKTNANDLAGTLVATGYDTAAYKLAGAATTCDGALTYGAMPKSNSGNFGADGAYKVCVKLTDNAGNPAAYDESSDVTLDTTLPNFTSIDLANEAADQYISAADYALASNLVENLVGTGYETISYKLVGSATTCNNALTYNIVIPKSNSTDFGADGVYKICVKLTDNANNTPDYGESSTITLDTILPVFTSIDLINDAADTYINLAESSASNNLVGNLSASGYTAVTYKLTTSVTTCDGALTYGALPTSDSADFGADGAYKVCVRLTDASSNLAYGASSTINLDKTPPSFTSITLINDATINVAIDPTAGYINIAENGNSTDVILLTATGYDTAKYKLVSFAQVCDGSLVYGDTVPKSNTFVFGMDGNYKVCVKLTDNAGNPIAYDDSEKIVLDTTAPSFTSISLANDATDTYINDAETSNANVLLNSLSGSGYDTATYKLVTSVTTCDGALTYGAMPQSNSADFGADGTYKVCVKLSDNAENTPDYDTSSTITLDTIAPIFTSIDLQNEATDGYINEADHLLANDLAGNLTGSGYATNQYKLTIDATTCDGALTYGVMPKDNSADFGADGNYKICVKLADTAGNITYNNSSSFVLDVTVPSFTSLALANDALDTYINNAETANANDLGGVLTAAGYDTVTYKLTTAATTCDGALTYGVMPKSNSGDFGADGTYKICVKLVDNAANPIAYGSSANIALDKTVPAFTSIALENDASDGYINVAEKLLTNDLAGSLSGSGYDTAVYKLTTSATTCDGALAYGAMPKGNSGDFGADGAYKVCVKLTDNAGNPPAYGNTSNLTLDNTAPSFTSIALANDASDGYINITENAAANDLANTLNASGYDTVAYKLATSVTTCDGALTYGVMPKSNSGDFGADGVYKVCVKLTDNAGNPAAYGNSTNIALDTMAPAFTSIALANDAADTYINATEHAAANDLVNTLNGTGYDTAAYILATAATICDGALTYGVMPKGNDGEFGADGSYKVCVKLTDNAGNAPAYGASGNMTLDTAVPSFTSVALANDAVDGYINAAEHSGSNDLVDSLSGSGYDTAAYKLTSSATTCDGALTYGALPKSDSGDFGADGTYKVCVKLTDNAGNTPAYGASGNITLDAAVPTFTSIALANDATDSYINASENSLANDLANTLNASGYDTAAYKLVTAATTCDVALTYGAMPKSNSGDFGVNGSYKVCVKLTDDAGNPAAYGSSATLTLDTSAPTFTSLALENDAADNYINTAEHLLTNDLGGSLNAANYDAVTYKLATSVTTCDGGLTYGAMPKSDSADFGADGAYRICVKLADNAGNITYGNSSNVTLDSASPIFTSIDLANDASDMYINLAESSAANDLANNLTASGYTGDTYDLVTAATTCDGALTYGVMPQSNSGDFGADGTYKICVKLADNAGNVAYGSSSNVTLDKTPPSFTSINLANDASDGYINSAEHALNNNLASGLAGSGYDTAAYKLAALATTCDVALAYGAMPQSSSGDFGADGNYKVCVKLTDNAGNTPAYDASSTIALDTSAPTFTSLERTNDAADGYINSAERANANDLAGNLSGSNYDTATYKLTTAATTCDGGLTYGIMPKSNSGDFGADGSYKVCTKLADNAGNTAYGGTLSFTLDASSPVFTSIDLVNSASDAYINVTEHAASTDLVGNLSASGQDTTAYKLTSSGTICDGALTYGALPVSDSGDFGADGTYKVCIKLSDTAGNAAYGASSTITLDTAAPSFTSVNLANDAADSYINAAERANANDLVSGLNGSNYNTAQYKLATSATTCDGALTYGALPKSNSGDFGADGDYKVCVKLTDTAGNTPAYGGSSTFTLDTALPPDLTAFTAEVGNQENKTILLSLDFPADTSDYAEVTVRMDSGATAPANCSAGSEIKSYTTYTDIVDEEYIAATEAELYSFRACAFDDAGNITTSLTVSGVQAKARHIMFVTSTAYNGNLGGLSGADQKCQDAADAEALSGAWIAVVSDTTVAAKDRLNDYGSKPVYNRVGDEMAANWDTIWASGISTAVLYQENGSEPAANDVWTGTNAAGTAANRCSDWTSNSDGVNGYYGARNSVTSAWIYSGNTSCDLTKRVYCISHIPPMTTFTAATGVGSGEIAITLDYPSVVDDYKQVKVRRLAGATAPNADCTSDGTEALSYTPAYVDPTSTNDTGLTPGGTYSYRVCVFDHDGAIAWTDIEESITAGNP